MSAADKIFDLWFAHSDGTITREAARSVFDTTLNANNRVKELVAISSPSSVRAVKFTQEESRV
jgi:hypothetical protein